MHGHGPAHMVGHAMAMANKKGQRIFLKCLKQDHRPRLQNLRKKESATALLQSAASCAEVRVGLFLSDADYKAISGTSKQLYMSTTQQ